MNYRFHQAIIAGTFDHLHEGHKHFIDAAFAQSEHVHINISLRKLTKHKPFAHSIQPYTVRKKNLETYLETKKLTKRATIHPLEDIYGMAATDTSCEALFVTKSTKPNAILINHEREKRNLPPLTIVMVSYRMGEDKKIISSKRIRSGETDREGNSYDAFFLGKSQYLLPEKLRQALQQPIGTVITQSSEMKKMSQKAPLIIAIGDIVSRDLIEAGYLPKICVIDYKTRRHPIDKQTLPSVLQAPWKTISNPHGTINKQFASYYREALKRDSDSVKTRVIAVEGEEDLLALPALLLSPIDSLVIYGQYNTGMIVVRVTEEIKEYARQLLKEF